MDVFNSRFHLLHLPGSFRDRHLPRGYAPFGIRAIDGFIYVTYAKQDADRHDDVAGPGHGFIDVFTPGGFLLKRLVSRGALDSPWGLEVAPRGFGPFGGKLLVGNFGNGRIHAYGLFSGRPDGTLRTKHHKPSRSTACGPFRSAPPPPAAPAPCCSAPASTTRRTAWSAPSTRLTNRY